MSARIENKLEIADRDDTWQQRILAEILKHGNPRHHSECNIVVNQQCLI